MSLYGDYIGERLGKLIYEIDGKGFATYFFPVHPEHGECVYIEELFVHHEHRRSRFGTELGDYVCEVARGRGIKTLLGSVNPKARGATESIKSLLYYGMKLDSVGDDGLIYFYKSLED